MIVYDHKSLYAISKNQTQLELPSILFPETYRRIWWLRDGKISHQKTNKKINKVSSHRHKSNLKFGLEVPLSVKPVHKIDISNWNTLGVNLIAKELNIVIFAFLLLKDDELTSVGSNHIIYHLIFDITFDLTCKSRLVSWFE